MAQLWTDILAILKAPFVGNLDLIHLFLLIGVILVFAAMWALVLENVRRASLELV